MRQCRLRTQENHVVRCGTWSYDPKGTSVWVWVGGAGEQHDQGYELESSETETGCNHQEVERDLREESGEGSCRGAPGTRYFFGPSHFADQSVRRIDLQGQGEEDLDRYGGYADCPV